MLAALQRTKALVHASARKYAPHTTQSTPARPLVLEALVLPQPESPTSRLLAQGIEEASAQRISSVFVRFGEQLKAHLEADYQRRCQGLQAHSSYYQDPKSLSLVSLTYLTWYTKATQQWASYLLDDFTPRLLRARLRSRADRIPSPRRPFNQRAIPYLEQFFDRNAFPSRLDKIDMADKFNMEFKQIHVWFQNRRSRMRKEGKEIAKPERTALVDELENAVVGQLLPPDLYDETDDDNSSSHCDDHHDGLYVPAPDHAFPSCYPPSCSYEPFPSTSEERKLELPWPRLQQPPPSSKPVVEIDEVIAAFSKLAIADSQSERAAMVPVASRRASSVWSWSVTRCPPAPHPALVRRVRRPPCSVTQRCTPRPVSQRREPTTKAGFHRQQRPSMAGNHTSLPSAAIGPYPISSSDLPSRRTKRSLPRRTPHHPSFNHLERVDTVTSSTSRASSLTSEAPSSGSDNGTPLSTPPSLPATLPLLDLAPLSIGQGMAQSGLIYDYFSTLFVSPSLNTLQKSHDPSILPLPMFTEVSL
ncbi:hypothetical protein C8T65DRAFT_675262 [Cerioporus squamosus]|nr:hypothetical protein C8T65DRAFT_675262 [Cerioporus squamosus]